MKAEISTEMLLTIAIPSFNGERFIAETIKSSCTQAEAFKDIEVLVMNNASIDNTFQICKNAQSMFPGLKIFSNKETLPVDMNVVCAISNSSAKYVWVLADDDVLFDGAISKVREVLLAESPSVLLTNFVSVDDDLRPIGRNAETDIDLDILDEIKELRPSIAENLSEVQVFESESEALNKTGFALFGLLSAMVVHRDLYLRLSKETRNSIPNGFEFMYVVPRLFMFGRSAKINRPLVAFRQYKKRWETTSDYSQPLEIFFVIIPLILNRLIRVGFDRSTIKKISREHMASLLLHVSIARQKGFRMKWDLLKKLVYENKTNPVFLLQLPLLAMPTIALDAFVKLYKSQKLVNLIKMLLK